MQMYIRSYSTPKNGWTVPPLLSTAILLASISVSSNAVAMLAFHSFEIFRLKAIGSRSGIGIANDFDFHIGVSL